MNMTNHTANFVPRLSERLKLVASFVPQDSRIADIGTDHGFVPICLAKEAPLPWMCGQALWNGRRLT